MQNRRQKGIYGRLASEKRQKGTGKRKEWKKKRAKLEGEKANIKRVDDVVSGCCFGMRTGPRRLTGSSKTDFASAGGEASNELWSPPLELQDVQLVREGALDQGKEKLFSPANPRPDAWSKPCPALFWARRIHTLTFDFFQFSTALLTIV